MEPKNAIKGIELDLELEIEELEEKIAPGELVWPSPGGKGQGSGCEWPTLDLRWRHRFTVRFHLYYWYSDCS